MSTTKNEPAKGTRVQFTVDRDVLADGLDFAVKGIPSRVSVPVLAGVLIHATGKGVAVSSFDYDQARTVGLLRSESVKQGRAVLPGKPLADMVKGLPARTSVTVTVEGERAEVCCGDTMLTLPTMPVEDFPTLPDTPAKVGTINASVLASQLGAVAVALCTEQTLPMLCGVRVEASKGTLALLATDRYRAAIRETTWGGDAFNATVPGKVFAEVAKRYAKDRGARVTVGHTAAADSAKPKWHGDAWFSLTSGQYRWVTRLLASEFPPLRNLLPAKFAAHVDVEVKPLLATLKRMSAAVGKTPARKGGGKSSQPVILDMAAGHMLVETGSEHDAKASEKVPCEYDDLDGVGSIRLGANPDYLADAVKSAGTNLVRLMLVDAFKPFLVQPLYDGKIASGEWHLVMPIKVNHKGEDVVTKKPAPNAEAVKPVEQPKPAPETPAEPTPQPVADAPALDRNTPHAFQRAVEDGKKVGPVTKCACGTTFAAKVHRVDEPAKAEVEPEAASAVQCAGCGQAIHSEGMQLADDGTPTWVDETGGDVCAVVGDDAPHRPEAAGDEVVEHPPVNTTAEVTAKLFTPKEASTQALVLFGRGEYAVAKAVIKWAMRKWPTHQLTDRAGNTYGWERILDGIQAKEAQVKPEAAPEPGAVAEVAEPVDEADTDTGELEPVEVDAVDVEAKLRKQLAEFDERVIQAAIDTALGRVQAIAVRQPATPVAEPEVEAGDEPTGEGATKAFDLERGTPVRRARQALIDALGDGYTVDAEKVKGAQPNKLHVTGPIAADDEAAWAEVAEAVEAAAKAATAQLANA